MTTDTTTTTEPIEPDPDRIQYLDPRELLMDKNIRTAKPSPGMVSSVRDYGLLQPIIAVATGDGRARVRVGHRRNMAAIANEHATVPVIVRESDQDADEAAAEAERLAQQYVENAEREGLTTAEQLDVFSGMSEMGMTAGEIARRTKAPRRDIAHAIRAARRPEVRESVEAANLTLQQAATLEEFADQPDAYAVLLDRAMGRGPSWQNFEHTAQRLRDDRDETAAREAVTAWLTATGVTIIEAPNYDSPITALDNLTDDPATDADQARPSSTIGEDQHPDGGDGGPNLDGEHDPDDDENLDDDNEWWDEDAEAQPGSGPAPITPEQHAGCPGHAAFVGGHQVTSIRAVYVCTDPVRHGHRAREPWKQLRRASAATPQPGETTEQAAARETEAKAEKAAARKKVIAGNKAWDAASTVRREWLRELLLRKTPPEGAGGWMAGAFVADRYTVCRAAERGHAAAAALLGVGERGHAGIGALLDGASENRANVITLAMVLGAIEGETTREQWRWIERGGTPDGTLVRYLHALQGWGYPLSAMERLSIGEDIDHAEVFDAPTPAEAPSAGHGDDPAEEEGDAAAEA